MHHGTQRAVALLVSLMLTACAESTGPDSRGASLGTVWNRFGSAAGYETDVAFGGIVGEPVNRVYMCELPGSPSAGLYKGLLSEDRKVITWDAVHGLPEYSLEFKGDEMNFIVFPGGLRVAAGEYREGRWTDNCDMAVGADGRLVNQERYIVITRAGSYSLSPTSVRLDGVSYSIRAAGTPCTALYAKKVGVPVLENGNFQVAIGYQGTDFFGRPITGTSNSGLQKFSLQPGCTRLTIFEGVCGSTQLCLGNDEPFGPFIASAVAGQKD